VRLTDAATGRVLTKGGKTMLRRKLRRSTALALAVAGAALAFAAQAGAAPTYTVSGSLTTVDYDAGIFTMSGGLIGDWVTTSYTELATSPLYRAKGTELFTGCLDRARDGSCGAHDPSGTMSFSFRYWAQFTSDGQLVWGGCTHPITDGTGAFTGATGLIVMVDRPTPTGVETRYAGTITLSGKKGESQSRTDARAAAAHTCGS
jgi:hypothetical protein